MDLDKLPHFSGGGGASHPASSAPSAARVDRSELSRLSAASSHHQHHQQQQHHHTRKESGAGTRLEFPHGDGAPDGNGNGGGAPVPPSYVDEYHGVRAAAKRAFDGLARGPRGRRRDALDWLALVLPCVAWLRRYQIRQDLVWDLLAGITVGFMVVPQGMSYATLAGVPAVYGLYGAFTPVLVYALFGSSRQLGVGPVAVTSLLIGSGIQKLVPGSEHIDNPSAPEPGQVLIQAAYNLKVIQLAFLVACLYTGVGVLRLGWLINFLSHSVITGFTSGAAIIIALSQVKYILGYSVPRADTLHESLQVIFGSISKFQWREFLMGTLMILWLVGLRFVSRRVPKLAFLAALGPISACVIGIVVVVAAKPGKLIKIVATIPAGMPPVTVGRWAPIDDVGALMALALVVMVVDLLESTSIARALARKNGYHLNYNQEIVGLGLANFAGAAFSSYTTTGSFSRSAVNNSSGARTQLAGFVTSIVVMFVLLFLTPVFAKLPYNTIAAIIIVGVTQLIEFEMAYYLFRTHLRDFFVWLAAFIGTLFLGAELGLAISIGLALGIVILESAFPHTAVLGRVERTTVYRNVEQYPNAETTPGVLAARLDAPVYFANVRHISEKLEEYEADAAAAAGAGDVEFVILEMTPVPHIDAMGAAWLEELWAAYQARGVQLVLSNPSARVLRVLSRSGFIEKLGREWVFVRVHDAVTYCKAHTRVALDGGGGGGKAVSPDGAVGAAPAHGAGDASVSPGAGAAKQRSFSARG